MLELYDTSSIPSKEFGILSAILVNSNLNSDFVSAALPPYNAARQTAGARYGRQI